ncbi:hypothetical protein L916_17314 [Phytophthora nicotianae]|uniref:Uncharacterized protein n=1 Tax=Phytophthora nicotianae TaxID=4792 RepID=W2I5T5_PHYNI|nr:hypothetical protein L916_17314 [Phytophthora nicotianae]
MSVNNEEDSAEEVQIEHKKIDASALLPPPQTGKRTQRYEIRSEKERVEREAAKQESKRTRTGLREVHERRRPRYLNDYVANVVQSSSRILDKNGAPIRASNVKILKNHREAMRSTSVTSGEKLDLK